MTLDPRDGLLQSHTPALMVPRFGPGIPPLERAGHRYLIAADGLWLEVKRPWLYARVRLDLAEIHDYQPAHRLPFGGLKREIVYAFSDEEFGRVQTMFLHDARVAMPDEFGAWAVYDERTGKLSYCPLIATSASPASLELQRPRLAAHEHLAIDLHSHGALEAFFSGTDDADDVGEVKLAAVVGRLEAEPMWAARLCLLGLFVEGDDAPEDPIVHEEEPAL